MEETLRARAARISLVVFDVDGVLTDGRLYLGEGGVDLKAFHTRDGQGLKMLGAGGIAFGVVSGRHSAAVEARMRELGAAFVEQGVEDKWARLQPILERRGVHPDEVAYVGDDLPDLPVMARVGLAITVAGADGFLARHAHWQTTLAGGAGAAREACELILEARGLLDAGRASYRP